ncbi:MAG: ACT domain-containing protein [Alcanivorax sp.]|jgi:glycine cleavage system regulatory protein|uniref:Glycine cleavage system transcriptional repressor n=2 Tax=root TaxID=1 RepID=M5DTF6_9GAMM|nr:ACT domain-containing protein [Thalassolituus oleivorans]PHQ83684.1 MAG: glycine cleavage system protein R [Thalassobium sp.]AHK15407.1 glycine cleavage system protein R [Thalassolituus oleivorans R6-15]APR66570.1 glycine cleavage system protein R [Thalassolituus oleivorans]MBQ0727077.1 glycine cleavage system protein R [Thalassolituus oleivorans]MBQ0780956.1 glycine cleavage system protein R [Thalassolituus oleivorans]|tara:strand:+ start:89 stop:598 length:510 start_codon:yes stop_codon:yes gene_type:complete
MSTFLVLTVIADDKPGIVEQLAATITEHGGNWLESRMAQMAGKFAGILRVGIEEESSNGLIGALSALGGRGISVIAELSNSAGDTNNTKDLTLSVVGNDRPGIVREVSQVLARLNVNVLELTTSCESAEMSALPIFKSEAQLRVPEGFDSHDLADALEAISDDLMVEIL